jgi:gp16 family phage-associated protein
MTQRSPSLNTSCSLAALRDALDEAELPSREAAPATATIQSAQPLRIGDQWPFTDPPAVLAARTARQTSSGGRPSQIEPNQVVRLVRCIQDGQSVPEAARAVGLNVRTARDVLAGKPKVAHHPAVTAAGVFLPRHSEGGNRGEIEAFDFSAQAGATTSPPVGKTAQNAEGVQTRSAGDAKAEFHRRGISLKAWASEHGVSSSLVCDILAGNKRRTCKRGQSHKIAVLLGLKAGVV